MDVTRRRLDKALANAWSGWDTLRHQMPLHRQLQEAAIEIHYHGDLNAPDAKRILEAEREFAKHGVVRFAPDAVGFREKF